MNATTTGLLAGLILGVAGSIGGFGPFLITLLVGIVGLLVGMAIPSTEPAQWSSASSPT